MNLGLVVLIAIASLGGLACASNAPVITNSVESDQQDGGDVSLQGDGGADVEIKDSDFPIVCDGSDGLRLAYQRFTMGGPGTRILWSPTTIYLNGRCELYVIDESWHDLHIATLTEGRFQRLSELLHVSEWAGLAGKLAGCVYDSVTIEAYWLAGRPSTLVVANEGHCLPPIRPASFENVPSPAALAEIYGWGAPANGPVWYNVRPAANESNPDPATLRDAPKWPFAEDIDALVVRDGVSDPLHLASGLDADKLHELRRRWMDGEFGLYRPTADTEQFVPVIGRDGQAYAVRMRDETPFDSEEGEVPSLSE